MNHALSIVEISSMICFALCDSKPSLARLAQTNKFFSEPALDALYSSESQVGILLQCLPRDLLEVRKQPFLGLRDELMFLRPFTEREIFRFAFYARRIRSLDISLYIEDAARVLEHLSAACLPQAKFVFPNLRRLSFYDYTSSCRDWCFKINALLSPRLAHLSTHILCPGAAGDDEEQSVEKWISTLPTRCPSLRRIEFGGVRTRQSKLSEVVSQWDVSHIDLRGSVLEASCLEHLGDSTVLRSLTIQDVAISNGLSMPSLRYGHFRELRHLEATLTEEVIFIGPAYPQLERLILTGDPLLSADFLEKARASPLKEVTLSFVNGATTTKYYQSLFFTLSHFKCLERLIIHEFPNHYVTTNLVELSLAELQPLLSLASLSTLDIILAKGKLTLHDKDLFKISQSWPSLVHLTLSSPPAAHPAHLTPSFNGLLHFSRCRNLKTLSIPINPIPTAPNTSTTSEPNASLQSLSLYTLTPVTHLHEVASFIAALFPNISHIGGGTEGGAQVEGWQCVNELLAVVRQ